MSADAPYRNCFYYYRGQRAKGASKDQIHERQFEDNSTKALLNVLEHGGLAEDFVQFLMPEADNGTAPPEFFLQGGPPESKVAHPCLVGISVLGEIEPSSWSTPGSKGRVDGAICWPNHMTVLIETKVVERMDGSQLNRHARDWKVPKAPSGAGPAELPASWILPTWGDIYRWSRIRSADHPPDSVAGFLLRQFEDYLELTGLAPFSGFRNQHFEYFALPLSARGRPEHVETRSQIRARLAGVWEAIKERDPTLFDQLAPIHVNNLRASDSQASAQTNADQKGAVNLTVEVAAGDLQLNLVGWTDTQGGRFERFFRGDDGRSMLRRLDGYRLVIWSRNANPDKAGNPYWMGAPAHEYLTRTAAEVAKEPDQVFSVFAHEHDPKWKRPGYHLRRSWLRSQVADRGDSFVNELVEEIHRLTPVMLHVNSV